MNEQAEKQKTTSGLLRTIILSVLIGASSVFMLLYRDLFAGKEKIFNFYMLLILVTFFAVVLAECLRHRALRLHNVYVTGDPDIQSDSMRTWNGFCISALAVMFLLTPPLLFVIITKTYGLPLKKVVPQMFTYAGAVNIAVICLICLLIYTVTNRLRVSIVLSTFFNLLFTLVNYALILFRSAPLMANDFIEIRTAAQVANAYSFVFDEGTVSAVLLSNLWIAAACSLDEKYRLKSWKRMISLFVCVLCFIGFYTFILSGDTLSDHHIKVSGWDPERSYKLNGYYVSFLVSFKQIYIRKPAGYSVSGIRKFSEKYKSDNISGEETVSETHPNIIVVMNESFSDLECFGKIKTNQDVLPFYHSLKKNTVKGTLHTSVYGGHTAVSEFEFLTGFSQRFMPLNAIPYSGIIGKFNVPSLTWNLKGDEYGGLTAFHPGRRNAYNRNIVYPLFGFDEYIASRDLVHPMKIRSFNSDKSDYDRLIEEYEKYISSGSKRPYYMFNVTIQNHGGFTEDVGTVEPHQIDILDPKLKSVETENFLNLMKISDEQLERLIKYFNEAKEPTVIMMFGDHQPRVDKNFYKVMNRRIGRRSSLERQENKYRTPFMIWANFDIEEEEGIEISTNYLSAFLLQKLGAPMTGYQKYLMDIYKKIPVMTDICTIDDSEKMYAPDAKTPYDDLIRQYECIQYNVISDNKHTVKDPFYLDSDTE